MRPGWELSKIKSYVVHELMSYPPVVLEDVEIHRASSDSEFLGDGLSVEERMDVSSPTITSLNTMLRNNCPTIGKKEGPIRCRRTNISAKASSGISVSLAPWNLGITS